MKLLARCLTGLLALMLNLGAQAQGWTLHVDDRTGLPVLGKSGGAAMSAN